MLLVLLAPEAQAELSLAALEAQLLPVEPVEPVEQVLQVGLLELT